MFFHSAGIEVSVWIPPLAAFVISFFTSMGGVSGAFLLLPWRRDSEVITDTPCDPDGHDAQIP